MLVYQRVLNDYDIRMGGYKIQKVVRMQHDETNAGRSDLFVCEKPWLLFWIGRPKTCLQRQFGSANVKKHSKTNDIQGSFTFLFMVTQEIRRSF